MRCRDVRALIERSMDGRVSLDGEFRVEEHARGCERCRRQLDEARQLEDLMLQLPSPALDRVDVPRALDAINAQLDVAPRATAPVRRTWRPARIAAAVVVLGVLGALLWTRTDERRPGSSSSPASPRLPGSTRIADSVAVPTAVPRPSAIEEPASARPAAQPRDRDDDPSAFDLTELVLDRERLVWAREQVRELIARCAPEDPAALDHAQAEQYAEALDEALSTLRSEAWPVRRIVEGLLDDPDRRTADAATRYLGVRGDRLSLAALEARLATDGKRVAAHALCDAGEPAFEALGRAVWDPELSDLVVARMQSVRGPAGVRWVRGALTLAPRFTRRADAAGAAQALAGLLARCGDAGLDALVDLAGHRLFSDDLVLSELAGAENASAWLVETIEREPSERDLRLLLNAAGILHPAEVQAWVEELCWSRRWASEAMDALASFDGTPATCDCAGVLATLLDLSFGLGEEDEGFLRAWKRAVERDPERLARFAQDRLDASAKSEARRYLELLVVSERAEAVPAILTLAASSQLGDEDRERAVLAAGELGGAQHLSHIARLFAGLERDQSELAAACLFAAHSMSESEGIEVLLAGLPERKRERILALFRSADMRRGSAVILFKLAREIEPVLSSTADEPWSHS